MIGMIVIAPLVSHYLLPFFSKISTIIPFEPSSVVGILFANDMGGMTLAQSICITKEIGDFNAFVVSSMLGCVISFTIPFSLGLVKAEQHKELFFGLICGIATVPVGSIVGGLICGIGFFTLLFNLLPLILLCGGIGAALILAPKKCIKVFKGFGTFMKWLGIAGLLISIFTFLTKITISPHFDTFENGAFICANACVTLSGMLPAMFIISKLLDKPLNLMGKKLGINSVSALALLGSLVTNASSFGVAEKMDKKGLVLNAAFAVSASFVFGSHMAFTMAFDQSYILPMIVGKIVSGIAAVALALLIYKEKATD